MTREYFFPRRDILTQDRTMSGAFDEAWDSAALSNAVCDELVKLGKIRTTPATEANVEGGGRRGAL
jgi:hypothetical protein